MSDKGTRDSIERLLRMMQARPPSFAVDRPAGPLMGPPPRGTRSEHNYQGDFPMMSQDDWRDALNPNEGCK